jgi:PAS domain S-box-containing protein
MQDTPSTQIGRFSHLTVIVTGGLSFALGLLVLGGWYTNNATLVQIAPELLPMQYHTALCFLLGGLGLLLLAARRLSWLAAACGIIVALIGLLTLGEYLLGVNLGIDQPVMRAPATDSIWPPGRMAPNVALCFALAGLALLILSRAKRPAQLFLITAPFGAVVLSLSLAAGIGYVTGLETYRWGYFVPMTAQTAIGGIILGGGIVAQAWRAGSKQAVTLPRPFPILVGIGVLTVALCLWQTLIAQERAFIEREVSLASASIQQSILARTESRTLALQRMALNWELQGKPARETWQADAGLYMAHYPELRSVSWVDAAFRTRWTMPEEDYNVTPPRFSDLKQPQQTTLKLARDSQKVTATGVFNSPQIGEALQIYVPILQKTDFEGCIVGTFHIRTMLDTILENVAPGYDLAIFENGQQIYDRSQMGMAPKSKWKREAILGLYGATWHIQVWPTRELLNRGRSALPEVVLSVGLVMAILFAAAVQLAQTAWLRTRQLETVNRDLADEITERTRTQQALAAQMQQMETVRTVSADMIRELDLNTLLALIVNHAVDLIEVAQAGTIYLWNDTTRTLVPRAWHNNVESVRNMCFALGEGVVGSVAQRRAGLIIEDYQTSPYADPRLRTQGQGMTLVSEPLMYRDRLIGVISVSTKGSGQTFTEADQQILSLLAAQAAIAIENAWLFAELQERTDHLMQLNTELRNQIAERQRAEEALQESEERFHSIAQSANDAIIAIDNSGAIVVWNKGASTIFGYREAEALGQPLTLLMPPRYREAYRASLERVHETGELPLGGKTVELQGRRRDSSEFPLEISLAMWQAGAETFYSGIIRDITARKQAEEQLQRQQEALYRSEKLAAMGSLLANVAHELNNPLAIVMMESDLLNEEAAPGPLTERTRKISQPAQRCVRIVQNFLTLARERSPERTAVQLNAIIEEAVELLEYPLRVDNVSVQRHLADDLPPLSADPHQIHQVMVNLITNAHQALREASSLRQLTITTRFDAARQRAVLELSDTGPGISYDMQRRIFEPFFTTKPPGVGTGLGLSLCQGIIEAHGGTISVESQPGQGTTFRIEFPVEAAPLTAAPPMPMPEAGPSPAGTAILVVDDEAGIANGVAHLLRRNGHEVDTAANGRLALHKLQERAYDLILCDLRMPELDGPGFYRVLEQSNPAMLQRIIFLTGDTLGAETKAFLEKTNAPRLNKPFTATTIRHIVHQALQAG